MLPRQNNPGGPWQLGNFNRPTVARNASGSPTYPADITVSDYGDADAETFNWDTTGTGQGLNTVSPVGQHGNRTRYREEVSAEQQLNSIQTARVEDQAWRQNSDAPSIIDTQHIQAVSSVGGVGGRYSAREHYTRSASSKDLHNYSYPPSEQTTNSLLPPAASRRRDLHSRSRSWEMPPAVDNENAPRRPGGSKASTSDDVIKVDLPDEDTMAAHTLRPGKEPKPGVLSAREIDALHSFTGNLPAEKGFPIQIGSVLFRLSGASIMSDAPSYFSKFFEEQCQNKDDSSSSVKTLYIDRDPATFQDIALHLQGYRILPRDGQHYVKLFSDAQFYSLPKLVKQLFESEICIRIGEKDFRIARDLFSAPGNSPNYFTLGFTMFAPNSGEMFPGLPREGLFRPPSIEPPSILNRSDAIFSDILHLLRGYPLEIRSPEHRQELLRDCRYYHFRGLEQQLMAHTISFNVGRQKSEIVIRLEDIRQSGVSYSPAPTPSDSSPLAGWVNYARPFVDETSYELIVELGDENTRLCLRNMRAEFFGSAKARITSLFQVVANKMNLTTNVPLGLMMSSGGATAQSVSPGNTPLSDDLVKVSIERDAYVVLDGEDYGTADLPAAVHAREESTSGDSSSAMMMQGEGNSQLLAPSRSPSALPPPRKRRRRGSLEEFGEWVVKRGQWRLRVQPRQEGDADMGIQGMEIVMMAVKLDAVSGQRGRNAVRPFLN